MNKHFFKKQPSIQIIPNGNQGKLILQKICNK